MTPKRILFAGMHDSGKTTFIAALWDYVNSAKQDKRLKLNSLANSENEYLEMIRSEWLQCKKISRTNLNKAENVKMNLSKVENNEHLLIEIPDISGELFNIHFQTREWALEYNTLVNEISGILLFINPLDTKNTVKFTSDQIEIEDTLENNEEGIPSETNTSKVNE